jgi:hypothetical protein
MVGDAPIPQSLNQRRPAARSGRPKLSFVTWKSRIDFLL